MAKFTSTAWADTCPFCSRKFRPLMGEARRGHICSCGAEVIDKIRMNDVDDKRGQYSYKFERGY